MAQLPTEDEIVKQLPFARNWGCQLVGPIPGNENKEMIIQETPLQGAFVIQPEKIEDERGFFARAFCNQEVEKYGLASDWVQSNISFNKSRGTLRGMHYQPPPQKK